jgi:ABC-2 type transport system permease protein
MLAEFKQTLRRLRGQIIGWSIGLAVYGLLMAALFDTVAAIPSIEDLIQNYPKEFAEFFGGLQGITTPVGYLSTYYFSYMTPIVGVFAAAAGASLIVGDEESGVLDLVLAQPVGRVALFVGRLAGLLAATAAILLVSWLSWVVPSVWNTMDLTWIEFLRPFLPLFGVMSFCSTLALLLSMVLPSARMASALSAGLLVGNYLIDGLANVNADLEAIVRWTPLGYYQGGDAITGLNGAWLAGLLAAALILALPAAWLFQRREIRVAGEHGWRPTGLRLPWHRQRPPQPA